MKFEVKPQQRANVEKYHSDDYALARKFADELVKELPNFIKAMVLFGSASRKIDSASANDIDVLIVIDDLTMMLSDEVVQSYRVITENTAAKFSKRFHITSLKLTTYWEYVRNGDPIAINMLRDGVALFDVGVFEPAQRLLFQGRIRPSKESIWVYAARAPNTLQNADWHVLQACVDLYWAVVDAAHAVLMKMGEVPPTPAHVADLMREKLVKTGMIAKKYADMMAFFYKLSKQIQHRQIQRVSGKQYDDWKEDAEDFVKMMRYVIEHQ